MNYLVQHPEKENCKKKENVAAQEKATSKTRALFFKTMIDMQRQIQNPHLHPQQSFLREQRQLPAVNYCRKGLHPRCWHRSRSFSDIHDILISYILIYPFVWGRTRVVKTFSLNRLWWFNIDHLPIYGHEFSISISCESKSKNLLRITQFPT